MHKETHGLDYFSIKQQNKYARIHTIQKSVISYLYLINMELQIMFMLFKIVFAYFNNFYISEN